MQICVCIKQVPDLNDVKIGQSDYTIQRDKKNSVINPLDFFAIEEGVRLKERFKGKLTILSMGPIHTEDALKEAYSYGADDVYLVTDSCFAGSDTLATSIILSEAVKYIGKFDLILMGIQSIDGDTGHIPAGVAEKLNIPHVTNVKKIENIDNEKNNIILQRLLEDKYLRIKTKIPIVLSVLKEINEPRTPPLRARIKSQKITVNKITNSELNLPEDIIGLNGSPTQVVDQYIPVKNIDNIIFEGEPSVIVDKLINEFNKFKYAKREYNENNDKN